MNLPSMAELLGLSKHSYKTFSTVPPADETHRKVNCPICGGSGVEPHWDCGSHIFSRCRGCSHIYQNPMPESHHLLNRYDEEYKEYEIENGQIFFDLMRYGLRDAGIFSLERKLLSSGEPSPAALDVGCATGVLVKYLNDRGWRAEGLEVCAPAADYGIQHRGVHIHTRPLEQAQLTSEAYDLVHFSHVIEHLFDINTFLAEIRRITRPGGHVVITTPNTRSFQAGLMGPHWRSAIADHTHLFNLTELRTLLRRHGFQPLRWKTWGGIPAGMAPPWLKKKVDRIARITGYGDVVMVMGRRVS
ncbi:class I SAM-dependent methyltransferase [Salinispira pacifica]|nr:class I SAM-dependent methyltransferase [Salinispira pacifica]